MNGICEECGLPITICNALASYRRAAKHIDAGRVEQAKDAAATAREFEADFSTQRQASEAVVAIDRELELLRKIEALVDERERLKAQCASDREFLNRATEENQRLRDAANQIVFHWNYSWPGLIAFKATGGSSNDYFKLCEINKGCRKEWPELHATVVAEPKV